VSAPENSNPSLNNCPICASPRHLTVPFDRIAGVETIRANMGDDAPYDWYLCESCGNAAPNRQPHLDVLEAYWDTNKVAVEGEDDAANWAYRQRIADIGAARSYAMFAGLGGDQAGRFLDVACGLGVTVKHFQDRGWDAYGVDTDATLKVWFERQGIKGEIGSIENVSFDAPFDLVQTAYSIYFITEPMAFLRRLHTLVKPGGHVGIVLADLLAYTQPGGPSYLHSWLPTVEGLEQALARAGFRVVLKQKVKDTWFVAATPAVFEAGNVSPPAPPVARILRRHRSRALKFATLGRGRQLLANLVKRFLNRQSG
jgi:SAM-dependent methyltransferase